MTAVTSNDTTFKSRIIKTELIEWKKAKWFQNDNLKELDEEGMEKLKHSLLANNFIMAFHVWEEILEEITENIIQWILDGHHRQKALMELLEEGYPIPDLLPATFIHCDNRQEAAKLVLIYSSIYAKITNEGLAEFIQLNELDFDELKLELDIPEFSLPRFEQKFNPIEVDEDDEEYEMQEVENITIKHGDIFQLGPHILYCGDGLVLETWKQILQQYADGKVIVMVFTDPPYNLPADYIGNKGQVKHKDFAEGKGEMSDEEFMLFLRKIMQLSCDISKDGALHYIWMDFRHIWHMTEAAREPYDSAAPKQLCVWDKDNGANGSFYRAKHELCFIFKHGEGKHTSHLELVDRIRYNVWNYPGGNSLSNPDRHEVRNHPTPKTVSMCKDAILDVTNEGDLVVDYFLGSGSTLIAADYGKRICFGSEFEPHYCHNIIARYRNHCIKTGQDFEFKHLNGDLTAEDVLIEDKETEEEEE